MGRPRFEPESSGFVPEHAALIERKGDLIIAMIEGVRGGIVSVGTPNFVAFSDSPVSIAYATVHGQQIETHRAFRHRINVQFATRTAPDRAVVRCWERGAGLTDACGTGACAVFAVGRAKGLLDKAATISLPGGDLRIEVDDSGELYKTGPATIVFEGEWLG
jgi:diaminopimelate epimerase